jgi:serine/threonine-protein kinase
LASSDDLTGHVIAGKYELLRLIRRGMGTVYEARVLADSTRCAVKLLSTELAADAEVVKRFFREARAMATVKSEHVVAAFDSGMDGSSRPYYAMEYLVGEDLGATLERLGSLNQVAATKILFQAAAGLARAHARGIVHRDVKPSNLFLVMSDAGDVQVKVLDFGIAKVKMEVLSETFSSVTRTGSLLGTPFYMSPEQMKRASSIDSSADVWSLGVLLWECLTGKLPWGPVESLGELIAAVLTVDIGSVQDLAPWVRPELAEIQRRMLSRDLTTRLSSAIQLLDALQPLVPDGGRLTRAELTPAAENERRFIAPRLSFADTMALSKAPSSPADTPADSRAPARRSWGLALGGVAVAAAVLVFVQATKQRPPTETPTATSVAPANEAPAAPVPTLVPSTNPVLGARASPSVLMATVPPGGGVGVGVEPTRERARPGRREKERRKVEQRTPESPAATTPSSSPSEPTIPSLSEDFE